LESFDEILTKLFFCKHIAFLSKFGANRPTQIETIHIDLTLYCIESSG